MDVSFESSETSTFATTLLILLISDSGPLISTVCGDAVITHTNLSDGTVAGVASKSAPAAGVQFLPVPPPDDASRTFAEFIDMVDSFKK